MTPLQLFSLVSVPHLPRIKGMSFRFRDEKRHSGNGSDQIKGGNIVPTTLLYHSEYYLKFVNYDRFSKKTKFKPSSLGKTYYFCASIELFYVIIPLKRS